MGSGLFPGFAIISCHLAGTIAVIASSNREANSSLNALPPGGSPDVPGLSLYRAEPQSDCVLARAVV
jgi:hypothetical protein